MVIKFRAKHFFLLVFFLWGSAFTTWSQNVTLKLEKQKLEKALSAIQLQTGYSFVFSNQLVDVNRIISVDLKDASLEQVFQQLFNETDLSFEVRSKKIYLLKKSMTQNSDSYRNPRKIIGLVKDASGEPIIGANVTEKGTSANGTITDLNGNFTLYILDGRKLIVSYIGYNTQEIAVKNETSFKITLIEDTKMLDELVVVGYGTQKKSDIISSVVSIKPEEAGKAPTFNVAEMLRGKAAGVRVSLGDAGPGGQSSIEVRGKRSITGGNSPIYIVDGVQIGNLNDINPSDMASIEVLKDAAAQAIYGARASNGVVLVTTKRGQAGKLSVSYNGYFGIQDVKRNFDIYNGEEYAQLKREADRTNYNLDTYREDELIFKPIELEVMKSGQYVNWTKEVMRSAPIQNHTLNMNVGSERTKVYVSIGYQNQSGVMPNTGYNKGSARINIDQKINKWMDIGVNFSYNVSETNDPSVTNVLQGLVKTAPIAKIYNDDGSLKIYPNGAQESSNPLLDVEEIVSNVTSQNNLINLFFDIKPFAGFKYRLNASRRSSNSKSLNYNSSKSSVGMLAGGGIGVASYNDYMEWQVENIFNYDMKMKENNLNLTFVQSVNESKSNSLTNNAKQFPNDILGIYGIESAGSLIPSIGATRRALLSFVGRAQYDLMNKYYLTASFRTDASTVFGNNNKWGYFPSVAIGWNIYQEEFIKKISFIDNLKLRFSYGSVGNEAISPYGSMSLADQFDYLIDGKQVIGYVPGSSLPNPNLKWETSTTANLALDFAFLKNKVSGTVEIYDTRTKDLLVNRTLGALIGYTRMRDNIGEVQNKGLEVLLNYHILNNRDWKVNAGVTFSKNINRILHLYGKDENDDGKEDDEIANNWFIGKSINVYYQYAFDGIWQEGDDFANSAQPSAKPGDIRVLDVSNADENVKKIGQEDKVITSREPDWIGSFSFDVAYKNFDFSFDVSTVQGIVRDNPYLYDGVYGGDLRGVFNGVKMDYWTPENPSNLYPRPNSSSGQTYGYVLGLQDASYIRLQNVTLGYSFSNKLLAKLHLSKARFYLTGQNLLTITDYQSYSPEREPNSYPEAITVAAGLQLNF